MENNDSILSEIEKQETEATYMQRVLANLFDVVIELTLIVVFSFLTSLLFPGALSSNSYARYILVFAVIFLYRLLSVMLFQKTIGMIVLRLKYLNANLQPLSGKEKLIAAAAIRNSVVKIYKER